MATARGINLRRHAQTRLFVANRGDGFRFIVEAYDPLNMPAEIFLFEKRLIDPYTGTTTDRFVGVASPFDLVVFPANTPDDTQIPAYFRKSLIDGILPTQAQADDVWQLIYEEVNGLVEAMNRMEQLQETEDVRCGEPSESSESASDSVEG